MSSNSLSRYINVIYCWTQTFQLFYEKEHFNMQFLGTLVTLTRYCTTEAQSEVGKLFIVQGGNKSTLFLCVQNKGTVVTRLQARKARNLGSLPSTGKNVFSKTSRPFMGSSTPYSMTRVSLLNVKVALHTSDLPLH